MEFQKEITLRGERVYLEHFTYPGGTNGLRAVDTEDHFYGVLSEYDDDIEVHEGDIAIKNYGRYLGFLDDLIEQRIITRPHEYAKTRFIDIPICKLLWNPHENLDETRTNGNTAGSLSGTFS